MSDPSPRDPDPGEAAGDAAAAARAPREPLLDQRQIDALAGFDAAGSFGEAGMPGVRAMLDAGAGPREPLPLLPVVCEDLARRLTDSLRAVFGGEVGVGLGAVGTVRYGDAIEAIALPAGVVTFRAEGWDGCGLLRMGPDFAGLVLDSLLGARPGGPAGRLAARPFSAIEQAILTRLADAVLRDAEAAFAAVAPVQFRRERVETDPRLALVAGSGDVAVEATLDFALDGRTATLALLLPLSTLEPVRAVFRQGYAGAKGGRDTLWSGHLATEIWQAEMEAEAVLHQCALPLRRVLDLGVGDTLMFDMKPTDLVEVRCGGLPVTRGRIGRVEGRIAVQIAEPVGVPRPAGHEAAAR